MTFIVIIHFFTVAMDLIAIIVTIILTLDRLFRIRILVIFNSSSNIIYNTVNYSIVYNNSRLKAKTKTLT